MLTTPTPPPTAVLPLLATLARAADDKNVPADDVVGAMLDLEKAMRQEASRQGATVSRDTLANLDGAWRLVFTTGTVDVQKRVGKISYFPLKAVQTFDTAAMRLTNGIFIGDFALVKFDGPFEWDEPKRRLNFDFDHIALLGLRVALPKGGAAELGAASGLGSKGNPKRVASGKSAFFNWISADERVATARGGGGGLALWRRL